ncbi:metallophosphoesterase family protein [Streptacidiphilus monticola]|uniref:Metallophosphoesterase n=1 Tax=Streptacidiphilus monticola TaxID=2161674 RepID=A0ABW1FVF9_9ACTN
MRVHVVSDVHCNSEALARAGEGADALLCLGDLLLFLDYHDHSRGIFPDLFGRENATEFVRLRNAKRYQDAHAFSAGLWAGLGIGPEDRQARRAVLEDAARVQYAELFDAFAASPVPVYATYGNVDIPALWREFPRQGVQVLDGQAVEIGGRTFGFVGGGLPTPGRTPYEVDEEVYAAKVAALDGVDVLCCHIPPAVPELTYDTVARRFERGSEAVLEAIHRARPRTVLFGHIHQPLTARMRIGRTECVNVGYFRGSGRPWAMEW